MINRLLSKRKFITAIHVLFIQAILTVAATAADAPRTEPLPPGEAFKLAVSVRGANTLVAQFTPAKGYYLYKNKIFFALKNANGVIIKEVRLPPGEVKNDPFFGTMEVYKKPFQIEITLDRTSKAKHFTLVARYQGCNEVIGVCYPPLQTSFDLTLP